MEIDRYSENQENQRIIIDTAEESSREETTKKKVFTVEELLNDFSTYPIAFKIKYISTIYPWDENQYGAIKSTIFGDVCTIEEFEENLPKMLTVLSEAISNYPNGIVLDSSGNLLKAQSLAQAKEKGIQNEYIESYIMQENRRKFVEALLYKKASDMLEQLPTILKSEHVSELARTVLDNNDMAFLNSGNKNLNDFVKECHMMIETALSGYFENHMREEINDKTKTEEFDISEYSGDTPEDIAKTQQKLEELLDIYSLYYQYKNEETPSQSQITALKVFGQMKQLTNVLIQADYSEMADEEVLGYVNLAIGNTKYSGKMETELEKRKARYIIQEMDKKNFGPDYTMYVFLQDAKEKVSEFDRRAIEDKQREILANNPTLRECLEEHSEGVKNGIYEVPKQLKDSIKKEVTTQYAYLDFQRKLADYQKDPRMFHGEGREHEFTKYLLGMYTIFKQDKGKIVSKDDVQAVLMLIGKINPDLNMAEQIQQGTFKEGDFVRKAINKSLELDGENVGVNMAKFLYRHSDTIRDNFATNLVNFATRRKEAIREESIEEYIRRSNDVILVDNSIEHINTNNTGQLNSYKTKIFFSTQEQQLYDRVKKTVMVESWVDNSNAARTTYLTTLMQIAHLKDSGNVKDIPKYERLLKKIEKEHPEEVKDCVGRSFEGMTDKRFSDVKKSKEFAGRKEDAALYEEALRFSCKKLEARVFQFFDEKIFPIDAQKRYRFVSPQERAEVLRFALLTKELINQTTDDNSNLKDLYQKMYERALDVISNGKKKELQLVEWKEVDGVRKAVVNEERVESALKKRPDLVFGKWKRDSKSLYEGYKFDYMQDKMEKLYGKGNLQNISKERRKFKPFNRMTKAEKEDAIQYYSEFYEEARNYVKLNGDREVTNMNVGLINRGIERLTKRIQGSRIFYRGMQAVRAYQEYDFNVATKMCFRYLMKKGRDSRAAIGKFLERNKIEALPAGNGSQGIQMEEISLGTGKHERGSHNQVEQPVYNPDERKKYEGAIIINSDSKTTPEGEMTTKTDRDEGEER